jgi:hypothetical protein
MLAAVNLPEERVATMNTAALVDAALGYPLFGDMFAYNTPQLGFETIASRSAVLTELLNRSDAARELLVRYEKIDIADVDLLPTDIERGNFDVAVTFAETLLAQPAIQEALSVSDRSRLRTEALRKGSAKIARPDIFGAFGAARSALIVGRLSAHGVQDPDIQDFLRNGGSISDLALKVLLEGEPLPHRLPFRMSVDDYDTYISTPNGSIVSARLMTDELTAPQIAQSNSYVTTTYPLATRETDASRKYNCHSYAWHNQNISNTVWLNTPGDDAYWNDGSYVLIQTVNGGIPIPVSIPNGAKVSYGLSDHSAIKVTSTQYRSKWGQLPRMLHTPGYCPYACSNCSFLVSYYRLH